MNEPRLIRFLILGLPIGLIITGVIGMLLYFRGDADAKDVRANPLHSPAPQ